jgi:hypothetical protein
VTQSHPFEQSISPSYCAKCGQGPGATIHLGDLFEGTDEEREKAQAQAQREEMETRLRSIKGDISADAGEMERRSPLFYGTGANPVLFGILLLLAVLPAFGQERPKLDKAEFALLAADAGSRALDVYSTHKMLESGYQEELLPGFIADHTGTMATYSGGCVVLDWLVYRRLREHHRKLAHVLTLVDIGQDVPWAIHNLYLSGHPVGTLKNPNAPIFRP